MSIGFDKRDYHYYDSDDDSFSEEEDHNGVDFTAQHHQREKIPLEWVDRLALNLKYMAEERALDLFQDITSDKLAEFIEKHNQADKRTPVVYCTR